MATPLGVPYASTNELYAASTVLPILGIAFVAVRLRRRLRSKAGLGFDDWFLIVALLFNIGGAISLLIGLQAGVYGSPTNDVVGLTLEEKVTHLDDSMALAKKLELAHLLQVGLALGFLKLSIIYFYQRIFVTQSGTKFHWACRACTVMSVLWMVAVFLALALQCGSAITEAWGSIADGKKFCQASRVQAAYVISDLISNALIWLLPIPMIWRLQTTRDKKAFLIGLFALTAFPIIACIIKVHVTLMLPETSTNPNLDWELTLSTILFWCTVESGMAIIAACLPDTYYYLDLFIKGEAMSSLRSKLSLASTATSNSSGRRSMGFSAMQSPIVSKQGDYRTVPLAAPGVCGMVDSKRLPCMCYEGAAGLRRQGGVYKGAEAHYHELEPNELGYNDLDAAKNSILVTRQVSVGSDSV